jgi:hypothetical protein
MPFAAAAGRWVLNAGAQRLYRTAGFEDHDRHLMTVRLEDETHVP